MIDKIRYWAAWMLFGLADLLREWSDRLAAPRSVSARRRAQFAREDAARRQAGRELAERARQDLMHGLIFPPPEGEAADLGPSPLERDAIERKVETDRRDFIQRIAETFGVDPDDLAVWSSADARKRQLLEDQMIFGSAFEDEAGERVDPSRVVINPDGTAYVAPPAPVQSLTDELLDEASAAEQRRQVQQVRFEQERRGVLKKERIERRGTDD